MDLSQVEGSGSEGRITIKDMINTANQGIALLLQWQLASCASVRCGSGASPEPHLLVRRRAEKSSKVRSSGCYASSASVQLLTDGKLTTS